jgi:hypothetical protein
MMIAACDGAHEKRNSFVKLTKMLAGYHDAIACADELAYDAAFFDVVALLRRLETREPEPFRSPVTTGSIRVG